MGNWAQFVLVTYGIEHVFALMTAGHIYTCRSGLNVLPAHADTLPMLSTHPLHATATTLYMPLPLPSTSVGEVRSGLVPGHFCRTGDRTVRSLTKFLGPGPGTAMNRLYWSGPGPDRVQTVPALFIYLFIQD